MTSSPRPNTHPFRFKRGMALALATTLMCGASWAEKPEWAGKGKPDKHEKAQRGHGPSGDKGAQRNVAVDVRIGGYFADPQRSAANAYYVQQFKGGRCPPGLAKKNNGCLPPGQAKKYVIGQPLPAGLVYYPVPNAVIVQLGAPPAGHKYVRIATDILLIAIGTSMVVDAMQDLGRI